MEKIYFAAGLIVGAGSMFVAFIVLLHGKHKKRLIMEDNNKYSISIMMEEFRYTVLNTKKSMQKLEKIAEELKAWKEEYNNKGND